MLIALLYKSNPPKIIITKFFKIFKEQGEE